MVDYYNENEQAVTQDSTDTIEHKKLYNQT